jgi:hypothetical protein
MRPSEPSSRAQRAPLTSETRDQLLRAIDELRALERERQGMRAAARPTDELTRQVEAKAREVFRVSHEADEGERRH